MAVATKKEKKKKVVQETVYGWREGSRYSVDPQVAGEELNRIAREADSELPQLQPQIVVDESKPEEAPLHPVFEWDDELAANNYRVEQARNLVRAIRIVDETGKQENPPVWVAVTIPETQERAYVETTKAWSQKDMRTEVLADAVKQLRGLQSRYRHLSELSEVFEAIDRLPVAM